MSAEAHWEFVLLGGFVGEFTSAGRTALRFVSVLIDVITHGILTSTATSRCRQTQSLRNRKTHTELINSHQTEYWICTYESRTTSQTYILSSVCTLTREDPAVFLKGSMERILTPLSVMMYWLLLTVMDFWNHSSTAFTIYHRHQSQSIIIIISDYCYYYFRFVLLSDSSSYYYFYC